MKKLKALEILRRELQNNYEKRPFVIKTELYHKERIEDFHEAIDELEALNNRCCDNCKYVRETNLSGEISHGEKFCNELVRFFHNGFYCNKWEINK